MSKKFFYFGNLAVPFLDLYPGAVGAYSMRELSSSYAGSCIRVRRSSDNAEQDIGFANSFLDTASLTSFVGANNGFVVKIYDQSGNGKHKVQASTSEQPVIISSGTLQTKNGFACPYFNGAKILVSPSIVSALPFSAFMVASDGGGVGFICGGSEDTSTNFLYYGQMINFGATAGLLREVDGTTTYTLTTGTVTVDTMKQLDALHLAAPNKQLAVDGTNSTSSSFANSPFPVDNSSIGGVARPVPIYGGGFFAEYIVYASDMSANRAAIRLNQKTYFSTP